ncbi:4a-hydroxytetrahydrobiopterin dehydratase [Paenactinomyces guangxiensis]|uniref:4a-hydroxytetrahydrobiopterin dehydratase n=1 Tax=Paenactinomyces guangxiensis TaxID=1490290 RepID=A0A7W1WNN7_9BACL|nr:4a-hydroxytetrahydrobiopterin dehydratase [Paenactinomyces guangxiensis]MBA4493240.1 4a-hydroxytetrahydrobiopterin dehydratase [Paenactinomyces guangxiensis]MBH8589910.1 4a-hydroxytetrahydrobiopterin dehydratase [Paenactinomyces guangxiensis]
MTDEQITEQLSQLPGWQREKDAITKTFRFSTYMDGIRFVQQVAEQAEKLNHHPDLHIGYCVVTVSSTTHDSGGITYKDFTLARQIETRKRLMTGTDGESLTPSNWGQSPWSK